MKKNIVPKHVENLYEGVCHNLDGNQQKKVGNLLCKYADSCSKNDTDLGLTKLVEHEINTPNARPIKQRPRNVPLAFAGEESN